MRVALVF